MLLPRMLEEVVLAVPARDYDRVVAGLAVEGIFHVDSPPQGVKGEVDRGYRALLTQASERSSRIRQYFDLAGVEPYRVSGVEIEVGGWGESWKRYLEKYSGVEKFYSGLLEEYSEAEARLKELLDIEARIAPVAHIDVDIARLYRSGAFDFAVYYGSYSEGLESRVGEIVSRVGGLAAVEASGGSVVVAVAVPKGALSKISPEILRLNLSIYTPPEGVPGSPREAMEYIRGEKSSLGRRLVSIQEMASERLGELAEFYTVVTAFENIFKFLVSTLRRGETRIVRGFVDVRDSGRLRSIVDRMTRGSYVLLSLGVRRGGEAPIPSKVDLPQFLKPFSRVVELYGYPEPNEIVPTVFLAITLPLTFALMFPDAGQGLLVLLFSLFYLRRVSRDWAYVIAVMGGASVVSGLLAGEVFGPLVSKMLGLPELWYRLGLETPPYAMPTYAIDHGEEELVPVLVYRALNVSLFMGAFMLSFGTFLGVVNGVIKRDWVGLVESRLPRFLLFASITGPFLVYMDAGEAGSVLRQALLELGGDSIAAKLVLAGSVLGLAWMLLAGPIIYMLEGHSPLAGLANSFLEAYESLLMLVGNIPSFLRIMALALAHSSLMFVIYYLTVMIMQGGILADVVGALLYVGGNLAVAAMEGLLAFAHASRLHFYEWFSKFYSGTGVPYTPIRVEGVRIKIAGQTF
ncbi:V-type ATP synthase subunit I [Aeropyrum pernix]|uniref:V-type ATP synthase subunit I n=1 Tax=Aeropyrum pernix TaxID=56636 RepID=UPI0010380D5B|nr:V-type ATP synthase subunit I [Aeropyrum pernix]